MIRQLRLFLLSLALAAGCVTLAACSASQYEAEAAQHEAQADAELDAIDEMVAQRDLRQAALDQAVAAGEYELAAQIQAEQAALQASIDASAASVAELHDRAVSLRERAEAEDSAFSGLAEVAAIVAGTLVPGGAVLAPVLINLRKSWRKKDAAPLVDIVDIIRSEFPDVDKAFKDGSLGDKAARILTEASPKLQQVVKDIKKSRG